MAEECDFQGLVEYITGNMMDDLRLRFFSLNKSKRKRAHKDIVSKAVAIEDSLQTESVNTEMYSVSALLQHPEDYTEDELRAMNAVNEYIKKKYNL